MAQLVRELAVHVRWSDFVPRTCDGRKGLPLEAVLWRPFTCCGTHVPGLTHVMCVHTPTKTYNSNNDFLKLCCFWGFVERKVKARSQCEAQGHTMKTHSSRKDFNKEQDHCFCKLARSYSQILRPCLISHCLSWRYHLLPSRNYSIPY